MLSWSRSRGYHSCSSCHKKDLITSLLILVRDMFLKKRELKEPPLRGANTILRHMIEALDNQPPCPNETLGHNRRTPSGAAKYDAPARNRSAKKANHKKATIEGWPTSTVEKRNAPLQSMPEGCQPSAMVIERETKLEQNFALLLT